MSSDGFGSDARFELYSITFEKLDSNRQQDLKTIILDLADGPEVIYERVEGEDIPIGKPLSLIGPALSCLPYNPIYLVFGALGRSQWKWRLDYDKEVKDGNINKVVRQYVHDPDSDSHALICYDLFTKGVDAQLRFRFVDNDERRLFLLITEGEISAVTGGSPYTKRVLRSLGSTETSLSKIETRFLGDGNKEEVSHGLAITLDRSELGVPATSFLEVTVKMKYYFAPFRGTPKEQMSGEICQTCVLKAPTAPISTLHEFSLSAPSVTGPKLLMEVTWSDDLDSRNMAQFLEVCDKYSYLLSPVEDDIEVGQSSSKKLTDTDHVSVACPHSPSIKGSPKVTEESSHSSSCAEVDE